MTERLFLLDAMCREAAATVLASGPDGIVLDRTPFYARAGGQPGDAGVLRWDGGATPVAEAFKGEGEAILHRAAAEAPLPGEGASVTAVLDWPRRWAHMRMHTALHLLCAVLPGAAVTGGQIGADRSRLDFDLPDPPAREAIEASLNALVAADHPVRAEWVEESVLDENPALVRTLSVKPPRGTGRLRLVRIGAAATPIDLQPCGGTHVTRTAAIGGLKVLKMESKGRQNRRIILALAEERGT
jgi:misacylated tRNA(Ala) deacylase